MATISNNIKQILSSKYSCKICDYSTERKWNLNTHLVSAKHLMATSNNENKQNECYNCNKKYKDRSGLWRHKKNCCVLQNENENENDENGLISTVKQLIIQNAHHAEQNKELHQQLLEQNKHNAELSAKVLEMCKNGITHNSNNNNNTTNNKFNLNLFLNDTCRDAMNITDFIKTIVLQLSDLDRIGINGYIDGVSNIITSKLNLLEENRRPIHCTDLKRETLYVKDSSNKWEKEQTGNPKIQGITKNVRNQIDVLQTESHDNYKKVRNNYTDAEHNTYQKKLYNILGGAKEDSENDIAIIKNISKEAAIEKK